MFKLLEANIALSGAANVTAFALGLSDREALLEFQENDQGNLGGSAFVTGPSPDAQRPRRQLPVVTADAWLARQGERRPVGLIKIDVEGHELYALRGMRELLERERAIVLLEALQDQPGANGREVLEYLRSRGYRHFYAIQREWRLSPWVKRIPKVRGLIELVVGIVRAGHYAVQEVEVLEPIEYPMVIASKEPLTW